jgi:hypothetical protein
MIDALAKAADFTRSISRIRESRQGKRDNQTGGDGTHCDHAAAKQVPACDGEDHSQLEGDV